MTLRRESRTPDDPTKPWGARDTAVAAAGSAIGVQSIAVTGVLLDLERGERPLTQAELKQSRVLIGPDPDIPEEMGPDWVVQVGSRRFEVVNSKPVNPGGTLVYYELLVKV